MAGFGDGSPRGIHRILPKYNTALRSHPSGRSVGVAIELPVPDRHHRHRLARLRFETEAPIFVKEKGRRMSIDINPETERVVRDEPGQGHFRSVDELILFGVRVWREHNLPQAQSRTNGPHKAEEFVEWAQSHPPSPPL